ncbi:radical SAM protein [Listeria innocua]|uniref:radical SAM protein n=1 Tax=Listeria innocua TaxID=1642 RepID=UPI0016273EAB|nr:radical SAM protein [Listeria innocua]MBC1925437.1 radical SAM protein [Listeria innocua]
MTIGSTDLTVSKYIHFLERNNKRYIFNSRTLDVYSCTAEFQSKLKGNINSICKTELKELMDNLVLVDKISNQGQLVLDEMNTFRKALRTKADFNPKITFARVSLTEDCNMACTYCFQQKLYTQSRPQLTNSKLEEIIDALINQNNGKFLNIQYFGGEPLIRFKQIELANLQLKDAKKKGLLEGFRQTITTNGTMMSSKAAEFLVENDFDVIFSLDGWEELNDKNRIFRNGKGTYQRVLKGMDIYKKLNGDRKVLITPTNQNARIMDKIIAHFIHVLRVDTIGFNAPQPTADGWEVSGKNLARVVMDTWIYCQEHGVQFHSPGTFIPQILQSKIPQIDRCADDSLAMQGDWPIYVSGSAKFSMCLVHHNEDEISIDTLKNVGGNEKMLEWHLKENSYDRCDTCIAAKICGGPCSLELFMNSSLNKDRCSFYKEIVEEVITYE